MATTTFIYAGLNSCETVAKREIDAEPIKEELESMGKRDRALLWSRLQILVKPLLKWHDQSKDERIKSNSFD